MRNIWDISPPVSSKSPAFPGDTPYSQHWTWLLNENCPVNVSAVTLSPHVGAHADAPLHYSANGTSAGHMDLKPFLGPCRVIHALDCHPLIEVKHIQPYMDNAPPRLLVRTCRQANITTWSDHFAAYAPDTIRFLADCGVTLVGLDTPSIDPATSKTLDSHHLVLEHDIRVLENLVLDEVPAGDYELIALPLAWIDADASPVRAILRSLTNEVIA